jgi:hypothetical protein
LLGFLSGWSLGIHDVEIKSIVNEYHWSPDQIDKLFCDNIDHHGLLYWYDTLVKLHEKIPKPKR